MVKTTIQYEGDLRCVATHGPSGNTLQTDAPVDNQGRGESFSPTDLLGVALGSCMATIMGIAARNLGVEIKGMQIQVIKEMTTQPPRKIARLSTEIWMPAGVAENPVFEKAALTCPVHLSLHSDIEKPVIFHWAGGAAKVVQ